LVALFLGLCGGARLSDRGLVTASHLLGHPGERRPRKAADAMRATVNGLVAAAIVAMGTACVLTRVPHPMLFTILTMVLAKVPFGARAALATALLGRLTHGDTWLPRTGFNATLSITVGVESADR
jgi:predicted PurR-regulated permease PerM